MSTATTLYIRQTSAGKGKHAILLTLRRPGQPDLEGEATIKFSLSDQERADAGRAANGQAWLPGKVQQYEEAIRHCQRIEDTTEEAINHHNLGHAFMQIPAIRDLDAAEAAYRRSFALHDPSDALGRSRCIKQIGMVPSRLRASCFAISSPSRFRDPNVMLHPPSALT